MIGRIAVLMRDLLEKPEDFQTSIKRTMGSIASIITHGHRAPDWDSLWAYVRVTFSGPFYLLG